MFFFFFFQNWYLNFEAKRNVSYLLGRLRTGGSGEMIRISVFESWGVAGERGVIEKGVRCREGGL